MLPTLKNVFYYFSVIVGFFPILLICHNQYHRHRSSIHQGMINLYQYFTLSPPPSTVVVFIYYFSMYSGRYITPAESYEQLADIELNFKQALRTLLAGTGYGCRARCVPRHCAGRPPVCLPTASAALSVCLSVRLHFYRYTWHR